MRHLRLTLNSVRPETFYLSSLKLLPLSIPLLFQNQSLVISLVLDFEGCVDFAKRH